MLPLRELRQHERVFMIMSSAIGLSEATSAQSDGEPRNTMRVRNKQLAVGLVLVGVAAIAGVQVGRYHARADALAAAAGFSGQRAFGGLQQLVELGPRPPGSEALRRAREYIGRDLCAPVRILGMTRLWPRRRWVTFP